MLQGRETHLVGLLGAEGEDDLANVNTGDHSGGLAESTTHTSLEPVR